MRSILAAVAIFFLAIPVIAKAKKSSPAPKIFNWRETANQELTPKENEIAKVSASPATVVTRNDAVASPIIYEGLQFGVSVQTYQPHGQLRVIGVDSYDASALGEKPMTHLQLRWLPLTIASLGQMGAGFYGSLGYAQHPVTLRGSTGASVGKTVVHSTLATAGAALEWPLPLRNFSFGADLGVGRLDQIQASVLQSANVSERVWIGTGGGSFRYRYHEVALALGYERRFAISTNVAGLTPQTDNYLLGLLYGFR